MTCYTVMYILKNLYTTQPDQQNFSYFATASLISILMTQPPDNN